MPALWNRDRDQVTLTCCVCRRPGPTVHCRDDAAALAAVVSAHGWQQVGDRVGCSGRCVADLVEPVVDASVTPAPERVPPVSPAPKQPNRRRAGKRPPMTKIEGSTSTTRVTAKAVTS